MYKHILIPTDGSTLSERAIKQGMMLAKALNAKVTAVTVSPTVHTFAIEPMMVTDTPKQYEEDSKLRAAKYLAVARDAARAAGVSCDEAHIVHDHPYEAIIDAATQHDCDLIFMASHGRRGVSALVLGSETAKVLTHSKIPTLVCRRALARRVRHRKEIGGRRRPPIEW
jgi:nucleotide-binding universal stress UspA family protein